MGQGVTKKCGEDFITTEIPKTAKVRKLRIKDKGKGVGKKSNKARGTPGHDSAQDQIVGETRDAVQDPDVLDIEMSKAETENLYVDNNNKSKAGPEVFQFLFYALQMGGFASVIDWAALVYFRQDVGCVQPI